MSNFPEDLKYASTHEWARIDDDGVATIGISHHAQDALGDIVFVELPEVGATLIAKEEVAVVESVKAASDIYSPLSGEVIEINEELVDGPEVINSLPYENGWFFKIQLSNEAEIDELMDAEAYAEHCDSE